MHSSLSTIRDRNGISDARIQMEGLQPNHIILSKRLPNMQERIKEFDALAEDLVKALDDFKVPAREKAELMGLFGPMKRDILEVL